MRTVAFGRTFRLAEDSVVGRVANLRPIANRPPDPFSIRSAQEDNRPARPSSESTPGSKTAAVEKASDFLAIHAQLRRPAQQVFRFDWAPVSPFPLAKARDIELLNRAQNVLIQSFRIVSAAWQPGAPQ